MDRDEIKAELDRRGIEYNARAHTDTLEELLASVSDQDPVDPVQEPVDQDGLDDGRRPPEEPPLDDGRTVEVVVMHKAGIQLDSTKSDDSDGYQAQRWRGPVSQEEYDAACKADDAAGRDHRLMAI